MKEPYKAISSFIYLIFMIVLVYILLELDE
jgi:hypothetical protein